MDSKKWTGEKRPNRDVERFNKDIFRVDVSDILQGDIPMIPFVILNFNVYCQIPYTTDRLNLPGEVALVAFTVKRGIVETLSTLIDPGNAPLGSASDVFASVKTRGLQYPGYCPQLQDVRGLVSKIDGFLSKGERWPLVFCMDSEINSFYACMDWLYKAAEIEGPPPEFRLRPLEMMLQRASVLGRIFRDAMDGTEEIDESQDVKDIRERMSSMFGIGNDMIPIVSCTSGQELIKFNKDRYPLTPAEELLVKIGKFTDEVHTLEYLQSTRNVYNEKLACAYHKKASEREDAYGWLCCCSELVAKRLAINCVEALQSLFMEDCSSDDC